MLASTFITIRDFCLRRGISHADFLTAKSASVEKKLITTEAYEKADVIALLAQSGAIAIRPFYYLFGNEEFNFLAAVTEDEGQGENGAEYIPMLDPEHTIVLPH